MLVKVCGMREAENIREVAAAGADWMGFIFYARSPRSVAETGFDRNAAGRCKRVGVFVDASPEYMMETATAFGLDYLQLHGNETPDCCYALQKRGYAVIKAFSIATSDDLLATRDYEGRADYFLFDTKCNGYGGSGRQFDWGILDGYDGTTPFLLSGGINPDSAEAIRRFQHPRLAGIDLNSGFETAPGYKDAGKLEAFLRHIK